MSCRAGVGGWPALTAGCRVRLWGRGGLTAEGRPWLNPRPCTRNCTQYHVRRVGCASVEERPATWLARRCRRAGIHISHRARTVADIVAHEVGDNLLGATPSHLLWPAACSDLEHTRLPGLACLRAHQAPEQFWIRSPGGRLQDNLPPPTPMATPDSYPRRRLLPGPKWKLKQELSKLRLRQKPNWRFIATLTVTEAYV